MEDKDEQNKSVYIMLDGKTIGKTMIDSKPIPIESTSMTLMWQTEQGGLFWVMKGQAKGYSTEEEANKAAKNDH